MTEQSEKSHMYVRKRERCQRRELVPSAPQGICLAGWPFPRFFCCLIMCDCLLSFCFSIRLRRFIVYARTAHASPLMLCFVRGALEKKTPTYALHELRFIKNFEAKSVFPGGMKSEIRTCRTSTQSS